LAIPTGIEVRFMLPFHFLAYALVSFWILPDFTEKSFVQKKIVVLKYIIGYAAFVLLCFTLSLNTYMNLQYGSYTLIHLDKQKPGAIQCQRDIYKKAGPVVTPGNGNLFVDLNQLSVEENRYYRMEFDVNALDDNSQLFYADFYGAPDYDRMEQDRYFTLKKGDHTYSAVLYTGGEALPSDVFFRIVTKTSIPLTITNIKVASCKEVSPTGFWKYRTALQDWFMTSWQMNQNSLMPVLVPRSIPVTYN